MKLNWIRPVFSGLWLVLGLALLLRDSVGLNWMSDRYAAENLNLGGGLAIAFAFWNGLRWLLGRTRVGKQAVHQPLAPKNTEERPFEYNPDLDFHKPDPE